jgi:hypothetical protein
MEANSGDEGPLLTVLESVRCLECGAVYAKPTDGGTVRRNPGCPDCGYVGWMEAAPLREASVPRRSVAGRRPHPSG